MKWRRVESLPQRRTKWRIGLHAVGWCNCKGALTEKVIHCSSVLAQKYYPQAEESLWVKRKKSIDIKGESQCELPEPQLVRAVLFDIMPGELGKLGKISGLITTVSVCVQRNIMKWVPQWKINTHSHIWKYLMVTCCFRELCRCCFSFSVCVCMWM